VNDRVISAELSLIRRCPERVLISGGKEKRAAIRAAMQNLLPTTFVTDEQTAIELLA
jgi:DNA-binding transcriptional regulator LsrR (DeoR family)